MEDSGPLSEELILSLSLTVHIWVNDFSSMSKSFLLYKMKMIIRTQSDVKVREVNLCKRYIVNLKAVYSFSQHHFGCLPTEVSNRVGRETWKLTIMMHCGYTFDGSVLTAQREH